MYIHHFVHDCNSQQINQLCVMPSDRRKSSTSDLVCFLKEVAKSQESKSQCRLVLCKVILLEENR